MLLSVHSAVRVCESEEHEHGVGAGVKDIILSDVLYSMIE